MTDGTGLAGFEAGSGFGRSNRAGKAEANVGTPLRLMDKVAVSLERLALPLFHKIDPETAHRVSLGLMKHGLVPFRTPYQSERLKVSLAGIDLPNPIGLAAGYDKSAAAVPHLAKMGFGFVEIGTVTPLPQQGSKRPRMFRLPDDRAVINRYGFNNDGAEKAAERLQASRHRGIVGLNIGPNADAANPVEDYLTVMKSCLPLVDYATINISSPNTAGLRDFHDRKMLDGLLDRVLAVRDELSEDLPVFLKISPDLEQEQIAPVVEAATGRRRIGLIATNSTVDRTSVSASEHRDESGGLSGKPLFEKSTEVLRRVYELSNGQLPLIGVGGIGSGRDAYEKIKAGASALQICTALSYDGVSLVHSILAELDALLEEDGFANVREAVGTGATPPDGTGSAPTQDRSSPAP